MNGFINKTSIKADRNGKVPKVLNLLHEGFWETPWHGDFEVTERDLHEYVANFQEGVGLVAADRKAPINYGHDLAGKAAAWIERIYVGDYNGKKAIFGDVTWTPAGEQAVKDGEWKYISSEFNPRGRPYQDHEGHQDGALNFVNNVLTGAALTNIPLLKRLQPIMASRIPPGATRVSASQGSEESDKRNQGERMKVEDLRSKEVKDLTDEEKKFLSENKADLTDDERTKFGLEDEPAPTPEPETQAPEETQAPAETPAPQGDGTPVEASAIAGRVSELEAQLKASREEGEALRTKIETKEIDEFLTARIKAGQIKQDSKDSWSKTLLASRGDARTALETQLSELPANEAIGKELGDAGKEVQVEASRELHNKVTEAIRASAEKGQHLTYYQAEKQTLASDTALAARVKEEEA